MTSIGGAGAAAFIQSLTVANMRGTAATFEQARIDCERDADLSAMTSNGVPVMKPMPNDRFDQPAPKKRPSSARLRPLTSAPMIWCCLFGRVRQLNVLGWPYLIGPRRRPPVRVAGSVIHSVHTSRARRSVVTPGSTVPSANHFQSPNVIGQLNGGILYNLGRHRRVPGYVSCAPAGGPFGEMHFCLLARDRMLLGQHSVILTETLPALLPRII
jgi:hypothetical protein